VVCCVTASSARSPTLPDDAAAVLLGGATPDACFLTKRQCMIQAQFPHCAIGAHGLSRLGADLVVGIEDPCVESTAGTLVPPLRFLRNDLLNRHVAPQALRCDGWHAAHRNLDRRIRTAPEKLVRACHRSIGMP